MHRLGPGACARPDRVNLCCGRLGSGRGRQNKVGCLLRLRRSAENRPLVFFDRERFHRRTAERVAQGLCPEFGNGPPAPERSVCDPCAAKHNKASRARDARLRMEGKPRRNPAKARAAERKRSRRETAKRIAQGLCTRCGKAPAAPDRASCESCLATRREADRTSYAAGKAAGMLYGGANADAKRRSARAQSRKRQKARREAALCIRCGQHPPVEGGTTCGPCRDRRQAAERQQYAERRARGLCTTCGATGREHGPFDSEADVSLCLAFAKLSRDQVSVTRDMSGLCTR